MVTGGVWGAKILLICMQLFMILLPATGLIRQLAPIASNWLRIASLGVLSPRKWRVSPRALVVTFVWMGPIQPT